MNIYVQGFVRPATDGDADVEPQEPEAIGYVPDLVADDQAFRRCGLGLGEKEAYLIQVAIKVGTCHREIRCRKAS